LQNAAIADNETGIGHHLHINTALNYVCSILYISYYIAIIAADAVAMTTDGSLKQLVLNSF